tara:strand:+ start:127 stop:333 length:207 start_codon:yes stop_codon:yes gene_type:complete
MPCILPAVRDDLQSKASSSGAMNVPKKSKIKGEQFDITFRIAGSVIVLKIIGAGDAFWALSLIFLTAL